MPLGLINILILDIMNKANKGFGNILEFDTNAKKVNIMFLTLEINF
jgi:hypothetical protein